MLTFSMMVDDGSAQGFATVFLLLSFLLDGEALKVQFVSDDTQDPNRIKKSFVDLPPVNSLESLLDAPNPAVMLVCSRFSASPSAENPICGELSSAENNLSCMIAPLVV
jgi:hypothetical protein